jgi:hypothetical protein
MVCVHVLLLPNNGATVSWLESQINAIHDAMDAMKKTFSGREQLRSEGWVVDEAEFADIVDPEEYARWSADADAQAYGEMA